jgi:glycosyltransferase involved in cell wall biosynthesis
MIKALVDGTYTRIEVHHVRLAFSHDMSEVGRFKPGKVLHLASVCVRILAARFRYGATGLYYPPAGPDRLPFARDVVTLLATRWAFRRVVLHYHAGGSSELYATLPRPVRFLARAAYGRADLAVCQTELGRQDPAVFGARRTVVIPCGIADVAGTLPAREHSGTPTILFVGVMKRSKGIFVLLEAMEALLARGLHARVQFMGTFDAPETEARFRREIAERGLSGDVEFLGQRVGDDKWRTYVEADIFCFPSFFESETFGLVVVEAMAYRLPVVATNWRGIPSVVRDGETGLLVEVEDAAGLTDALALLVASSELRERLGTAGRQRFLDNFTLDRHLAAMEAALAEL